MINVFRNLIHSLFFWLLGHFGFFCLAFFAGSFQIELDINTWLSMFPAESPITTTGAFVLTIDSTVA
jgi:hypothetical protein